jgi:hypothetical protein
VWFWDGRSARARALAQLDTGGSSRCDKVKPEALTVLQGARGYQLLVSDRLCDGGALVFTVAR